jgi:hypothetical protein
MHNRLATAKPALFTTSRTSTTAGPTTPPSDKAGPLTTFGRLRQPAATSIQPERRLPLPLPRGRDGRRFRICDYRGRR